MGFTSISSGTKGSVAPGAQARTRLPEPAQQNQSRLRLGCFLTRDTDLYQPPYAYCGGDPVNFSDPTGHKKNWWQRLTQALSAAWGIWGGIGKYIAGGISSFGIGDWLIHSLGDAQITQINNQALKNEASMLNSFQQSHPDADLTQQLGLYQYMQQSTLKADGNLAADAAKQYYQGMSGLR